MAKKFIKGLVGSVKIRDKSGAETDLSVDGLFAIKFGLYDPSDKKIRIFVEHYASKSEFKNGSDYIQRYDYTIDDNTTIVRDGQSDVLVWKNYFKENKLLKKDCSLLKNAFDFIFSLNGTDDFDTHKIDWSSMTKDETADSDPE